MSTKPDLIIFSQNLLGGGASFHKNMIENFPKDIFNIKCIYLDPVEWNGAKSLEINLTPNDFIFSYGFESKWLMARRLNKLIPNSQGAIISNLEEELVWADIYGKKNKTLFFICHDAGFIPLVSKYQSIIDVIITHNIAVYNEIIQLLSARASDVYFIQHGVNAIPFNKIHNNESCLNVVSTLR